MHPIQRHLFTTNFRDLAGSRLAGTLAVSDELINLGILDFLEGLKSSTAPTGPDAAPATPLSATPDPKALLQLLDVKQLKVRALEGRIMVEVDVELVPEGE